MAAQLAHPLDTHPVLAQRARALNVDAAAAIAAALAELHSAVAGNAASDLEREITADETEFARLPGARLTLDSEANLPALLDLQAS
jgi:hypothetical protein